MTMRRFLLPLFLLVSAACESPRPSRAEYLQIVPQIAEFMERDARDNAYGQSARGPLIVNVESFRGNGLRATRQEFSTAEIERAIGRPLRNLPDTAAILCEESQVSPGCWIREYGVLLRLNLIRQAPDRIRAFATSTVTDQRFIPAVICDRRWELLFEKRAGQWVLTGKNLLQGCAE